MNYYRPRVLEEDQIILNFVGDHQDYEGVEALRRSSVNFGQFARYRIRPEVQYGVKGGPWIIPLMRRENARLDALEARVPKERETDIQGHSGTLLISQRARDIFERFVPENTEILPVEVENSDDVFWVRPICIEASLNVEKSYASIPQKNNTVYEVPVLIGEELNGEHLFCFREGGNLPVFSETLVQAIKENDLYGFNFREIEVV